ncbi:MAG TPA: hypothetical protein VI356_08090 [Myxococcales bacterium]
MVRVELLLACVCAFSCGRGAIGSGKPAEASGTPAPPADPPDAAVLLPPDAGTVSAGLDGGPAGPPAPSFPTDPPDPGDLSLLTTAPPTPQVAASCDAASVTPAPPGHHPGPCMTLGVEGDLASTVFSVRDTYADGRLATEQREEWASIPNESAYGRTELENSYDMDGRLQRITKRSWAFSQPHTEYGSTSWARTDYWYGDRAFSTQRIGTTHLGEIPGPPPPVDVIERDDFVVDALGKSIQTRQRRPVLGGGFDGQVTFHPNGAVALETFKGSDQWFAFDGSRQFDDAGRVLVEDTASFRSGYGTGRDHVESSYDGGRLIERRIESGHYSDWQGEPLLDGTRTVETYVYEAIDAASGREPRLLRIDSTRSDGTCVISDPAGDNHWVSDCTWTDRPGQHTEFRYDDSGNLVARIVTDASGNELSRWTAVADANGNVLCEQQSINGVLSSISHYDYGCWR